jgi:hypothetical protein
MVAAKKQHAAQPSLGIGALLPNPLHALSEEEAAAHKRIEAKLNFRQPLLPQLSQLSQSEYATIMSRPRHHLNGNNKHRGTVMFSPNQQHEAGSKSHPLRQSLPYLGLVAQLCVIIGFCTSSSFIDFVVSFVLFYLGTGAVGMITVGEYILHRFLFHPHNGLCSYFVRKQGHACHNDAVPRMFINFVHHHVFLSDADRVVPHYTIYLCIIPAIMGILLCVGLPLKVVALIGGGLITGSLVSDCLHYSFHFGPSLDYQWYRDMKAAHHAHHYRDSNRDFGITTDLVDRCLGTKSPQTDNTALNRLQRGDLLWDVKSIMKNEAPRKP